MLAVLVIATAWTVHARADDDVRPVVIAAAAPAPEQPVRLPAFKVGGIRSGQVLMISDSGTESIKLSVLAQRQMTKPSPFSDFCNAH